MKAFVLCACVLAFASFSSATVKQTLRQSMDKSDADTENCMTEHHMNIDEWYTEDDIVHDRHTEAGNEEKTRKNGCTSECILKKSGVLHGTEFNEATMREKVDEEFSEPEVRLVANEIMAECMKEAKSHTGECEKGLAMYVCTYKAIHELQELAEELEHHSTEEEGH